MGAVTKSQIPAIAAFMPRFWEAIKATYIPEKSAVYWKDVLMKLDAACAGLYGTPEEMQLCKTLLQAYGDYLDEKGRQQYGQAVTNENTVRSPETVSAGNEI